MNKQQLTTMVMLIALMVAPSLVGSTANRDGCQTIGDACVCKNTGVKGICFPGSQSITEDQLYCNCQGLTMTPQEVINTILQKTAGNQLAQYDRMRKDCPRIWELLTQMNQLSSTISRGTKIGGRSLLKVSLTRTPEAQQAFQQYESAKAEVTRLIATGEEPILQYFYQLNDGCSYVNQECQCGNTGLTGVCSINKPDPKTGKVFKPNTLYCHCD